MAEKNRVLVTGGTGLIGSALVNCFAAAGWEVIAQGRQKKAIPNCTYIEKDLSEAESGTSLLHQIGKVDLLINNAADQSVALAENISSAEIENLFKVNVFAPAELMIAAKKSGAKLVINISSIESKSPRPGHEFYGATKSALESLTRSLAFSLAPMRINAIRLGLVGDETLTKRWPEGVQSWNEAVPAKRFASPEEVANFALLLTDSRYEFATGAIFDFDGGKSTSPGW